MRIPVVLSRTSSSQDLPQSAAIAETAKRESVAKSFMMREMNKRIDLLVGDFLEWSSRWMGETGGIVRFLSFK